MAARDQVVRVVETDSVLDLRDEVASPKPDDLPTPKTPEPPSAETPAGQQQAATAPEAAARGGGRRRKILFGLVALVVLGIAGYGSYYTLVGRFRVSTDDAYVRADNTTLGARVSGHIESIAVADNSHVNAGDVIIKIDNGDYRLAVEAARARIATQQATIERIGQQIAAQTSAVDQARAQLDSAKAGGARAVADYDRQQALNDRGFASKAALETSLATRDQASASVQNAQAAFSAAAANVEVVKAQQVEAQQQLAELKTQLAKAERDLDFTQVRAPVEGVFSNRLVNAGDYVQPGQRLGNIVPLHGIYIDANFKETQLERLKPGQPVKISIDAFSTHKIDGVVESLSAASGAVFSLLPPDNATGNFTKIVQRVPVRIRVPNGVARARLLRPGMSVYVTVDTRNAPDDPAAPLEQPQD